MSDLARLSEVRPVPWANGRGTTRELLRREAADGQLLLRLSVADVVEPGPFSALPGIDRVLVAIEGPGFDLSVEGRPMRIEPLVPFAFAGETPVAVTAVAGPSRDFNVMTARALACAHVAVHRSAFAVRGGALRFAFVVAGRFALARRMLVAGDLLTLPADDSPVHASGEGCAITVALEPNEAIYCRTVNI